MELVRIAMEECSHQITIKIFRCLYCSEAHADPWNNQEEME